MTAAVDTGDDEDPPLEAWPCPLGCGTALVGALVGGHLSQHAAIPRSDWATPEEWKQAVVKLRDRRAAEQLADPPPAWKRRMDKLWR